MKKITVQPLVGFGNVTFGMKRENVRQVLAGFKKGFQKSPFTPQETDDFGYCHVYYDSDDKCEAVEFFTEIEINIDGQKVFPGKVERVQKIIADLMEEEDGFWISKEKSVGITTTEAAMETILFGCKNYYN